MGKKQAGFGLTRKGCKPSKMCMVLSKRLLIPASWLSILLVLVIHVQPIQAQHCPSEQGALASPDPVVDAVNPNPSPADFSLPMPCGGKMILRHVCVPAEGYFTDLPFDMGCKDCGRLNNSFMEGKRWSAVSGPFMIEDLPSAWRVKLKKAIANGNGRCPEPGDPNIRAFYYFIGKYEITNFQWRAVMDDECSGSDSQFSVDDPRPKTNVSWFEAVEFTRKYTEWLIKNAPEYLPKFFNDRYGYLRLPTEAEWEYAARGGHMITESQLNDEEFFPLNDRPHKDFAIFSDQDAAKPQQKLAWIGSKCANPLGLFDTAGNAAEMVLDPFHFSVGFRLHGAAGGFIVKGGSFRKSLVEIMPGRREEQPYFLSDGAFRSTDVGLRLVLSGILTPQDRKEKLDQEWANLGVQQNPAQASAKFSGSKIEIDQSKDPIAEIERFVAVSTDETEKKNLLFLREVLKQNSILLKEQESETVKGIIRSALFTAESMQNYAIRRKVVINELSKLEKMKDETVSQSILDSLESGIAKAKETVRLLDSAMDHFGKFYLNRIRETQRYPAELFESQINLISQELSLAQGFSRSLKDRLDVFRRHVALYKRQAGNIRQEEIQLELILQ
jgi:hypothetical protein